MPRGLVAKEFNGVAQLSNGGIHGFATLMSDHDHDQGLVGSGRISGVYGNNASQASRIEIGPDKTRLHQVFGRHRIMFQLDHSWQAKRDPIGSYVGKGFLP